MGRQISVRTPKPPPAPVAPPTTVAPDPRVDCDPSYPDICLPGGVGDTINCGDIPRSDRPVRVRPPDPHRLDGDGDGFGCAS